MSQTNQNRRLHDTDVCRSQTSAGPRRLQSSLKPRSTKMPARPNPTSVAPQTSTAPSAHRRQNRRLHDTDVCRSHTCAGPRRLQSSVKSTSTQMPARPHPTSVAPQTSVAPRPNPTPANRRLPTDVCQQTSAKRRLPEQTSANRLPEQTSAQTDVCPNRRLPKAPRHEEFRLKRYGCADVGQKASANRRLWAGVGWHTSGGRVALTSAADVCGTTWGVCRRPYSLGKLRLKRYGCADVCHQTPANTRLPTDACHKTSARRRLQTDVCPQTSANRRLPTVPDVCQKTSARSRLHFLPQTFVGYPHSHEKLQLNRYVRRRLLATHIVTKNFV